MKVAIVGGGIGGLTAAIALRRDGHEVTLFEQHERIAPIGSGISLSTPPLVVLDRLGVDVDAVGIPVDLDFARADGTTRTGVISRPDLEASFGASVFSMLRPTLHDALLALIPDDALRPGTRVEGFTEYSDQVVVVAGESFDLLVGADGIHSAVRDQLWGPAPLRPHGLVAWQGWSEHSGLSGRQGSIMHSRHAQVGHLPLRLADGSIGRQWWYIERGTPGGVVEDSSLERLVRETRAAGFMPAISECVASTDPAVLIRRDIQDKVPLKRWSRGRVTLLGDAAHATSPYAGYGAGMAIEDGWQLAKVLARGGALAEYDRARIRHTTQTVQFARLLGRVFHSRSRAVQTLRDGLFDRTPIGGWGLRFGYLDGLAKEMQRI